jgi:hypothetical protein
MNPATHVLVVSADEEWRSEVVQGLNQAAGRLDNPFGLMAVGCPCGDAAVEAVLATGPTQADLQVVVIDHGPRGAGARANPAVTTAQRIIEARPELSLYMVLEDDADKLLVEQLASDAVDGYFFRGEHDFNGWFRIVAAEIAEKAETPFYNALREYVAQAKDSWHTPGHGGGDSFKGSPWVGDFYDFVGEQMLRADLSVSVPELDSLLHPMGVIAQAQKLAAKAFGARKTYFATNGTSTANKVIFQTLLAPGDKLLLDRNCHKSVHHGVILSGARPVYLDSSVNRHYGIFGPVPKATLAAAIEAHPDAKVLIPGCEGADSHQLHLRRPALRPEADHRDGARRRHQGHHRRGLVRPRALPPRAAADRARMRRRLRDAEHAQDPVGLLAGQHGARQRPRVR